VLQKETTSPALRIVKINTGGKLKEIMATCNRPRKTSWMEQMGKKYMKVYKHG